MVVCKFFQQGNCRYGQSCRFEHIFGSKYSYHASSHTQSAPQAQQSVTDDQLVDQVQSDVQATLKGGQWLLSCYAPFKEKIIIPGLSDLSPEEARLFIYEAKANNNLDAAITYMNNLIEETMSKYKQLLQPSMLVMKVLRSIFNGEPVQSPFVTQNKGFAATDNSATSIFRGAVQNTGFSQSNNNSIFGRSPASNTYSNQQQNTSIFGGQADAAKSIFANANQNVFSGAQSPNIFQNTTDMTQSPFAQATQQNIFGDTFQSKPAPANVFATSQNIFGQIDVPKSNPVSDVFAVSKPSSIFQISDRPNTNVFGAVNADQSANINEEMIYSRMEDLSPSVIEAYKSSSFKLGFVPELPPPACLCKMN